MAESSEKIKRIRSHIELEEYQTVNTNSTDYPGVFPGLERPWSLDRFKEEVEFKILRDNGNELEFDLVGVDVALANALRRTLMVEVPTIAIEKVYIHNNTSIIQDEVLAHRLGLIPLKADPRLFEYKQNDEDEGTAEDTLTFNLKIKCKHNPNAAANATQPDALYINNNVYTGNIIWEPRGKQAELFKADMVGPVHDDILLAKMRPGQILDLKLDAVKGIGQDHAKFSPVATVAYRLVPHIELLEPILGKLAHKLRDCFSPGVIGIRTNDVGIEEAYVINARLDSNSRNVFRHEDLKDKVKLSSLKNRYIFSVESTGALPARILVSEAFKTLMKKIMDIRQQLHTDAADE